MEHIELPTWAKLVPLPDPEAGVTKEEKEASRLHYEYLKDRPRKIQVNVGEIYPKILAELEAAGIKDKDEPLTQYWLAVCRNFTVWQLQELTEGVLVEINLQGNKTKWAWNNYTPGSAKFENNKFRRFEGPQAAMQGREARTYYKRLRKSFPAAQASGEAL